MDAGRGAVGAGIGEYVTAPISSRAAGVASMSRWISFVLRFYNNLLRLYPRGFRDEFADEMRVVFTQALTDAMERGGMAWLSVCWREVRDLPATLWRESAFDHEKAGMNENTSSLGFDEKRLSWREMVLGLFPFAWEQSPC